MQVSGKVTGKGQKTCTAVAEFSSESSEVTEIQCGDKLSMLEVLIMHVVDKVELN